MSEISKCLDDAGFNRLHQKIERMHKQNRKRCITNLEQLIELAPTLLEQIKTNKHDTRHITEELHVAANGLRDAQAQLTQCRDFLNSLDWLHDIVEDNTMTDDELLNSSFIVNDDED